MTKILFILLLIPAFCQAQHQTTTQGITRGAADARYVLRNPYYDGSQSVTVASATVTGASSFIGAVNIGVNGGLGGALAVSASGGADVYLNRSDSVSPYGRIFFTGLNAGAKTYGAAIYGDNTGLFLQTDPSPTGTTNQLASRLSITSDGAVTIPGSSFSVGTSTLVVTGGKVGVGTAVSATYLLNVGGDINIGVSNGLYSNGRVLMYSGATGTFIKSYDSDASDGIHFLSNTGNAERMFIREDGNVGIGTTAPESKLHVAAGLVTISTATTSVSFTTFGGAATKEELIALAPSKLFQYMTCTDCPTATLVCSTGTSAGNWADAADKTATPW